MKLTRYIIQDDEGNSKGMVRFVDFDVDWALEAAILEEEESLVIPDPYPENSMAFFTEKGLKEHEHLIDLWIENVTLQNYIVRKIVVEIDEKVMILYQDDSQVILCEKSSLNIQSETVIEVSQ